MTKDKFGELMKYLESYYQGHTPLDKMALNSYWESAKNIPDDQARALYNDILKSCRYFPNLVEFREILGIRMPQPIPLRNTQKCFYCMDSGSIAYIKTGMQPFPSMEYKFSARCPLCNMGKMYSDWPAFDQIFNQEALEQVKQKNLELFGAITVDQEQAGKIAARQYGVRV